MSAVISDMPDTRISAKDMPNARPISRLAIPGDETPVLTTSESNTPNDDHGTADQRADQETQRVRGLFDADLGDTRGHLADREQFERISGRRLRLVVGPEPLTVRVGTDTIGLPVKVV